MEYHSSRLKNLFRLQWIVSGYLPVIIISLFLYFFIIKVSVQREVNLITSTHSSLLNNLTAEAKSIFTQLKNSENLNHKKQSVEKGFGLQDHITVLNSVGSEQVGFSLTVNMKGDFFIEYPRKPYETICINNIDNQRIDVIFQGGVRFENDVLCLLSSQKGVLYSTNSNVTKLKGFNIKNIKDNSWFVTIDNNNVKRIGVITSLENSQGIELFLLTLRAPHDIFFLNRFLNTVILMVLPVLFIIIFFFNYYLKKRVFYPLDLLITVVRKVEKGDYSARSKISINNEIGELSDCFDGMLNRLSEEIARRKKAEEETKKINSELEDKVLLRTKEFKDLSSYLEKILQTLPVGMMRFNNDGKVSYINNAADIIVKRIINEKFSHVGQSGNISSLVERYRKNQSTENIRGEIVLEGIDKESRVLNYYLTRVNDNENEDFVIILDDVSDIKKLEKEKTESEKMFSYGILATGMAHDYANILNRIRMAVDLLPRCKGAEERNDIMMEIDYAVKEGRNLTQSLLSFSRHEQPLLIPVNIKSFFMDFIQQKKQSSLLKNVLFDVNIDYDYKIMAEINFLNQIFTNLLENARKALKDKTLKIVIKSVLSNKKVAILFSDNGQGIPASEHERVFEPFYSSGSKAGWGLGLALVKKLIEQMGGDIVIVDYSEGCTFKISFPLLESNEENA